MSNQDDRRFRPSLLVCGFLVRIPPRSFMLLMKRDEEIRYQISGWRPMLCSTRRLGRNQIQGVLRSFLRCQALHLLQDTRCLRRVGFLRRSLQCLPGRARRMRGPQEGDKLFRTIESGGYRRISDLWHKTDLQPSGIASQHCHPFNSGWCDAQFANRV